MTSRPIDGVTPAARVVSGLAVCVSVATAPPSSWALGVAAAYLALCVALARPPARRLLQRVLIATLASAMMLLPYVLGAQAQKALPLMLRSASAVLAAVGLSLSLHSHELATALRELKIPEGLSRIVGHAVTQLGSMTTEIGRLSLARQLRGARGLSVNLELVGTFLIRSSLRAEARALASALRGAAEVRAGGRWGTRSVAFTTLALALALAARWPLREWL